MSVVLEMPVPMAETSQNTINPRKRKKRAPAPGATVDCFTCAERRLTCDRKRPFCSQCLDAGKDCSGYKTQLTWGVGVASRGKLRGLSLPVAGTERISKDASQKNKRRKDSSVGRVRPGQSDTNAPLDYKTPLISPVPVGTDRSPNPSELHSVNGVWNAAIPRTQNTVGTITDLANTAAPPYQDATRTGSALRSEPHQTFPFQTIIWENQSSSVNNSYALSGPASTARTRSDATENHGGFDQPTRYNQNHMLISPLPPTFNPTTGSSLDKDDHITHDGISMLLHAGQSTPMPNVEEAVDVDEEFLPASYDESAVNDELVSYNMASSFNLNFNMPAFANIWNIGRTTRMQYLINYYSEVISPVIVAFDGPTNPFRTHILRLATSSETLQHAISALSASNLRQRRGIGLLSTGKTAPARRSSFAHVHLSNEYTQGMLSPEEQMREETLHKRMAVSQLNQQLAHPVMRKDDSTLATLLILCLFHICDSGVAKFQTQFAGVRKILALRGDDGKSATEDSRWMTRLFTWFDSLAATVNDRENQITGHFLDIPALCGDWSLENMAGIDSRLFRMISRLSELNMLQQGKSTLESSQVPRPMMRMSPTVPLPFIDGNGWLSEDSDTRLDYLSNEQFWKQWEDVRHELLTWQLDTTLFDTVSREASSLTVEQRIDLENISQSFRYSALLYLERLAHPGMSCSDEVIQMWVRQSLHHIKRVQSDVYLLWPLFITGSECIDDEGRGLIRGRCTDIQKDSGFVNNASCLQLLEKIWRFNSPNASPRSDDDNNELIGSVHGLGGSALMFRKVMIREAATTEGEGEYIVV